MHLGNSPVQEPLVRDLTKTAGPKLCLLYYYITWLEMKRSFSTVRVFLNKKKCEAIYHYALAKKYSFHQLVGLIQQVMHCIDL